jgi:hypothetical protein
VQSTTFVSITIITMFSDMLAKAGLLAAFAVNAAVAASTVPTISAVGSKFFYSNGTQYFIKGMRQPSCSHSTQLLTLQP